MAPVTHKNFCVLSYKNESGNNKKPIIVVSKKVSSSAVVRNTVRRRIREILIKKPISSTGKRLYIRCLPGIEKISFLELKEMFNKALSQLV